MELNPNRQPTGNSQANSTIEQIHQVLCDVVQKYNLQETYVYEDDPWMGILAQISFVVHSTYHTTKNKVP